MIKENGVGMEAKWFLDFLALWKYNKSIWMLLEHRDEDDDEGII